MASTAADVVATLADMERTRHVGARRPVTRRRLRSLLLSGPNLNLLGEREPADLRDGHPGRPRGRGHRGGRRPRLRLEHLQSNHEGDLVEAVHARPGPGRRHHRQRRRPHPHLVVAPRRPGRLRRGGGGAPPVQPGGPRAVPPHLGHRPGGRRLHRRLRGARLPAGRRGRAPAARRPGRTPGEPRRPGPARRTGRRCRSRPARRLRARFASAAPTGRPAVDGLLVTTPANIRWLTGFTGSAGLLLVTAGRGPADHRRPLPDPVGRAAGRGRGGRPWSRHRRGRRSSARPLAGRCRRLGPLWAWRPTT